MVTPIYVLCNFVKTTAMRYILSKKTLISGFHNYNNWQQVQKHSMGCNHLLLRTFRCNLPGNQSRQTRREGHSNASR